VTGIAWAYTRFGSLPQANLMLHGIKPVVLAVVLHALWGLVRSGVKSKLLAIVCVAGIGLGLTGINQLIILLIGGLAAASAIAIKNHISGSKSIVSSLHGAAFLFAMKAAVTATSAATPSGLLPLFLFFLKVGSVLFGGGYVLLAFLHSDLVVRWHWLSQSQLLDAIAVGQMTPGPFFTTATFIGYLLFGLPGAFWATVGIFLPGFILVALSGPIIPRIRRSALASSFLDGVVVASLSLMAVVTYQLGRAAVVDILSIILLGVSAILLIRYRVNSAWLVLGGAVVGLLYGWSF
jgi:chromate transporter